MYSKCSGVFKNFKTGGGGGVRSAVEFLGSGDCFVAPSHIPYVENKIHIANIIC